MPALEVGDVAPEFTLPKSGGGELSLRELRGQKVVLFFYPKDDTPGCTKEACAFRDNYPQARDSNAVVLGVSPDSVSSHDRFVAKYGLPFTLLADTDHAVAEQYGSWTQKSMYGRKYMGIQRSSFLIDEAGKIARVWPTVKPREHAEQVLAAIHETGSSGS